MILRSVVAGLCVIVFGFADAQSQDEKKVHGYFGIGLDVPIGDLADGWNIGFHGDAAVGFLLNSPTNRTLLELLGEIGYHTFGLDDQGFSVDGGSFSCFRFGPSLKINFSSAERATPFILLGAGVAIVSISDITVPGFGTLEGDSETEIFVKLGFGMELRRLFFKAEFANVFTEGSNVNFLPLTLIGFHF